MVNVLGALLLALLARRSLTPRAAALVRTGLLGAFTTYSTLTVAVAEDLLDGASLRGVVYLVVTLAAGLGATWLAVPDREAVR